MRVLFLTDADYILSPAARQWFCQMSEMLVARGVDVTLNKLGDEAYDIAIIHRARPNLIRQVLDHSPAAHIGVFNPGYHPAQELVDNADFFIVTTFIWRDLLLPYGRRVYLTLDYDTLHGKPIKQHTRTSDLIIGYHGNKVHYARDFFPHGANALKRLAREHDFTLEVITNDVASQPRIEGVDTKFVEFDLESFAAEVMSFDIGICPVFSSMEQLADPDIYVRNSNRVNTLLFYGIPSVTSPIPQACHDLTEGETVLFAVSEEAWYQALKRLITQPDLRNHIGQAGREMVAARFSTDIAVETYVDMLNKEIELSVFLKKGWRSDSLQTGAARSVRSATRIARLLQKFMRYVHEKKLGAG